MSFGIIVTLPGYDVQTATPEQCAVHSDYPSPKIEENHWGVLGPYTFGSNPGTSTTTVMYTVPHGYSYVPACFVYANQVGQSSYGILPSTFSQSPIVEQFIAYADTTNLTIAFQVGPPDGLGGVPSAISGLTFQFKYYIFTESGA